VLIPHHLTRPVALAVRRRRLVLLLTLLFCVGAGALSGPVTGKLLSGGYDDPAAESVRAAEVLTDRLGAGPPNLVLLVTPPDGLDGPATVAAAEELRRSLAAEEGVAEVGSYWSLGRPAALRSDDGRSALVLATLPGEADEIADHLEALAPRYENGFGPLAVTLGGQAEADREMAEQTERDLIRAELLVTPIILLLLVVVFRGIVAALLPMAVGVVAVVGALAVLRVLTELTEVSVFALNLTTGLGLGLAIDYSLFLVSRYREELWAGHGVTAAIATTMRTAGRTVLFSALTVGLCLSGLLVFPLYFLRSFAYAGIAVVAVAAVAALTFLPALLAVLGPRVDKWSLRRRPPRPVETGTWHRVATVVMRWPVRLGVPVVILLLLLGAPFLHIQLGLADARVLPRDAAAHQVSDALATRFAANESQPLLVVTEDAGGVAPGRLDDYARTLSRLPAVTRVDARTGSYADGEQVAPPGPRAAAFGAGDATYLAVVADGQAYGDDARRLVDQVRSTPAPFPVLVGGEAARFTDTLSALTGRLPLAGAIIALSMLVLLFLLTGSLVLPVKALVLNLISLSATFGAMVWIFQDGHLQWLTGDFAVTGVITATIPILVFCVAFGLSMDYEVFLLSRIKEEHDGGADNRTAVARGLERTGSLVTAAALLVAVVFLSFLTSGITYMKLLGLGLAIAVLMDATLIRGVLVPAFMRLAGDLNWWAPGPLARLHRRAGLTEVDPGPRPVARPPASPPRTKENV
jgi:RND superfamily putative drug exporter